MSTAEPGPSSTDGNETRAPDHKPVDIIQRIMGSFGKYHILLCILIFLSKIGIGFHQMAIIFFSPKVEFTCKDTNAETCPCADPIYDTSIFTRTIITEWHLICERKWLTSFTQTLFQLGTLMGSVLFGMASDRFGRRYPLIVAVIILVTMGVAAAFITHYWTFNFFRFLIGFAVGGTMVVGFVLIMEFVGTQYREVISAVYQMPFNLGHLLLPLIAYFFRDFYKLQLALSLPLIVLLCYCCLIPETPRWLLAAKRTNDAIKILERVAKVNNRPVDKIRAEVEVYQAELEKNRLKKGSILDLFRTPNLRKNIMAMSFNWLSCSYCFYGVSQYVGQLSGNAFINVAASAFVSLLGTMMSIPLMKAMGRRTIVITFDFICAFCLILLSVMPEGIGAVICACVGVVSSFIVFVVVYLYCSELFPTVVRNAAIGFSSMMARVGSMVAPFVVELHDLTHWVPPLVFGIVPLIAGFVTFLLPETKGCALMTTIEEGEQYGKKKTAEDEAKKLME